MSKQTRPILCLNCKEWKQSPNVELGTCEFDDTINTTCYDTRCIIGLYESVKTPEIEITTKKDL